MLYTQFSTLKSFKYFNLQDFLKHSCKALLLKTFFKSLADLIVYFKNIAEISFLTIQTHECLLIPKVHPKYNNDDYYNNNKL